MLRNSKVCNGISNKIRNKNDLYETPPEITEDLFTIENFEGNILEPACGKLAMVNVINKYYKCIYSDLIDYGNNPVKDFLKDNFDKVDNIITNPPYKYAQEFVEKAMKITNNKIAMILKLQFLEGQKRFNTIYTNKNFPLSKIYIYYKRVGMGIGMEKYQPSAVCYAWYIWDKNYTGKPIINWIK